MKARPAFNDRRKVEEAPLKEFRMFAQALANRLACAGVHYGWAIVAIVFLLAPTTAGCMGISGALITSLTKEFDWSTEQISVALAPRIVLFGLMAPFTAALIDKCGFKSAALGLIEIGLIGRTQGAPERLVEARA
jgi:hypothetical protein